MPRLSLWHPQKSNDYRYLDKNISEMFTIGGVDIYLHKYLGPQTGTSEDPGSGNYDATQPNYGTSDPLFIQDLFLLENRDRAYDPDVYRMRTVFRMQDIDFNLTQFGLFLQNDTLFMTFHYNVMIDTIGRKIMSGDVIEVPNLQDPNPLNANIAKALPKYYVVQDAAYAAEGFSQTWWPHLWRIKATPMVNAQEYQQILNKPFETNNIWDPGQYWTQGTVVNNGDIYYKALQNVTVCTPITDTDYWQPITSNTVWNKTDTYPEGTVIQYGDKYYRAIQNVPAGIIPPNPLYWVETDGSTIGANASTRDKDLSINDALLAQAEIDVPLSGYDTVRFYVFPTNPDGTPGDPNGPTIDDTIVTVDGSPAPNVADAAQTPRGDGWTMGYLTGDGIAPNGLPVTPGISFPTNPHEGDYALRLDYFPNRLFRFNGATWVKIEDNVRTPLYNGPGDNTLRSSFVNNTYTVPTTDMGNIPSRQSLSELLKPKADNGDDGGNKPARPRPGTQPGQVTDE